MSAESNQPQQRENYVDPCMKDALDWLNVVGQYEQEVPKPDTPYNRAKGEVLRYLADRMAEGDAGTATLLSTFEHQARQATSTQEWISDVEVQDTHRTTTFHFFAEAMNRYADRPYNN